MHFTNLNQIWHCVQHSNVFRWTGSTLMLAQACRALLGLICVLFQHHLAQNCPVTALSNYNSNPSVLSKCRFAMTRLTQMWDTQCRNLNQQVIVQPSAKHSQGQTLHGFGLEFLNEAIVREKVFFLVITFQKWFLFSLFFLLRHSSRLQSFTFSKWAARFFLCVFSI